MSASSGLAGGDLGVLGLMHEEGSGSRGETVGAGQLCLPQQGSSVVRFSSGLRIRES